MASDHRLIKRSLMSWGTGRSYLQDPLPESSAAIVFLEDAEHVQAVVGSDVVTPGTVVYRPGGGTSPSGMSAGPHIVEYEGSPTEAGGELSVGDDVFVQIQDYATSEYMSLIGPTLIRIIEPDDFSTFVADADRAVDEGTFASFAVHPAVQFAEQPALGAGAEGDGTRLRLHLSASGEWSTSATGVPLGALGEPWGHLQEAWERRNASTDIPCAVCLGRVVPEAERVAALRDRPWLGYYLSALAARRDLAARRLDDARVSGFGGRLSPPLAERRTVAIDRGRVPGRSSPVLAWTDDLAFLHLPDAARTFQINRDAAAVVEALLVCGSVEAACEYASREHLVAAREHLAGNGVRLEDPAELGH